MEAFAIFELREVEGFSKNESAYLKVTPRSLPESSLKKYALTSLMSGGEDCAASETLPRKTKDSKAAAAKIKEQNKKSGFFIYITLPAKPRR